MLADTSLRAPHHTSVRGLVLPSLHSASTTLQTLNDKAYRAVTGVFHALTNRIPAAPKPGPRSIFDHEKKMLESLFGKYNPALEPQHPHEQVHQFCHELISASYEDLDDNHNLLSPSKVVKGFIARVAFLAKNDPQKNLQALNLNAANPFNAVRTEVNAQVAEINKRLEDVYNTHARVGLQSPDHAYFVAFHLEIMKASTMPDGTLNEGFIPILIEGLLSGQNDVTDWQKESRAILQKFADSKDVQSNYAAITKPALGNQLSRDLIRVTLDQDPETEPTDTDSKITAGTVITPNRQGPVGNCFVECNIDWFQRTVIGRCLNDAGQLIKSGELIRGEGDNKVGFPFIFDIADEDLQTAFQADQDGKLNSGAFLWESPGIQSACRQLSIKDVQGACKQAASILFDGSRASVTPRDFLEQLAKLSPRNANFKQDYLWQLACLAFSAKTNTPILHAYASSLAGMDQYQAEDSLHKKMSKCWGLTFQKIWSDLAKAHISPQLLSKVTQVFNTQINRRMEIEYDESIETPLAADGSSTAGSFVYFEHELKDPETQATPIRTYKDLTNFALHSLEATNKELSAGGIEDADLPQYKQVIVKIRDFINTGDTFANLALSNYDASVKKLATLDAKWTKFMSFCQIGGDNTNVFKNAYGISLPDPTQASANTARERLVTIIKFLRDREKQDQFLEHPERFTNYEMDTDDHALVLDANDPSVKPFIQSTEDIEKLIDQRIVAPCQAVSNSEITAAQKYNLVQACGQLIPTELQTKFASLAKNCHGNTIHLFSQQVLSAVLKLNPDLDDQGKGELMAQFTNVVLYKVLTSAQLEVIKKNTVSVPDTNWEDDNAKLHKLLRIYFGFTLNPESNNVELFQLDERDAGDNDGGNPGNDLYALSQPEWIGGPWNLYGLDLNQTNPGSTSA